MTNLSTSPVAGFRKTPTSLRRKLERLFFPATAVIVLAITLWGFKDFYFAGKAYPGRPLTPPIRTLVIVHAVLQMAWVLLFIVQPTLVALCRRKTHMMLGRAGAVLAVVLVVTGYQLAVEATRANPPDMTFFGMGTVRFIYVPLTANAVFAVMVAVAIWQRKRPALHRAMMLTATVNALSAAMARIDWLNETFAGTWWDQLFGPLHAAVTLGLLLLAIRWALIGRFDKWLGLAVAAMAVTYAVMLRFSATGAWDSFARMLIG
jgi:hypothetical protein